MIFYAYIYRDPRKNNEPFYVGKGTGARAYSHLKRSDSGFVANRIRKMLREGVDPIIEITTAIDEEHAFFLEKCLISVLGRYDLGLGPLLNLTDGGEGASGYIASPETRLRKSIAHKGKPLSAKNRLGIGLALRGKPKNPEAVAKMRKTKKLHGHTEAQKAANLIPRAGFSMIGRTHSEESKLKMSIAKRGVKRQPRSAETKAKISAAWAAKRVAK